MTPFYSIRSKFKVALILLIMVTVILVAALLERKFFNDANITTAGIYNDRLIPATALFHITDNIYQAKNILSELHHHGSKYSKDSAQKELKKFHVCNDSIINAFEQTYLTPSEAKNLKQLKVDLGSYRQAETKLLNNSMNWTPQKEHILQEHFNRVLADLHRLSQIQTKVGKELLTSTENNIAQAHLITNLQIVAAIVLSIISQVLIFTSNSIKSPIKQRHNLN